MRYLIFIMVLFFIPLVDAYDINSTVRIEAEYRYNGTLTNSTANISVQYPDLSYAVFNDSMIIDGIGLFSYNFTCSVIGMHTATAVFYDGSEKLGNDTSTFQCGEIDKISWGYCPSGTNGYFGMWILIVILVILAIIGFIIKSSLLSIAAGIMMMFFGLITWQCGDIVAYFNIIFGIIFMLVALFM